MGVIRQIHVPITITHPNILDRQRVASMILGITGHRDIIIEHDRLVDILIHRIYELGATTVMSGMAIGYDLAAADAALRINIQVIAACPFDAWDERWDNEDKIRLWKILKNPLVHRIVLNKQPRHGKQAVEFYRIRNQYIVDNSDAMMAGWSGDFKSGTGMTVRMAQKAGIPIHRVWGPDWKVERL